MSAADIDSALLDMTDAQINAALVRRAQAKEQRKKEQSAARARKYRGTESHADRHAPVTPSVTQEMRDFPSERHANHHAPVTLTVTQKTSPAPAPSSQVSPTPPSFPPPPPAPTHTPARSGGKNVAPKPDDVPIPEPLSNLPKFAPTWGQFIESRRLIGAPMTYLAAERLLVAFALRPADAVDAVNMAIEKQWQGFNWKWFDNERAESPTQKTGNQKPNGTHFKPSPGSHGRPAIDRNEHTANAGNTSDYSGVGKVGRPETIPDLE